MQLIIFNWSEAGAEYWIVLTYLYNGDSGVLSFENDKNHYLVQPVRGCSRCKKVRMTVQFAPPGILKAAISTVIFTGRNAQPSLAWE